MKENQQVLSGVGGVQGNNVCWEWASLGHKKHVQRVACSDEGAGAC